MSGSNQRDVGRTGNARVLAAVVLAGAMALVATACGSDDTEVTTTAAAGTPVARGQQLAGQSCSSCHGQNFEGVKNLGPALTDNDFIRDHTAMNSSTSSEMVGRRTPKTTRPDWRCHPTVVTRG